MGLTLLMSIQAYAKDTYDIVMYTDAQAKTRAEEFKEYLLKKPPFNKLGEKVKISIVELSVETMGCKNDLAGAPRVIKCNSTKLFLLKAVARAHLAMAFTSQGTGGSGGPIPVASKDYPIQTMFHEMLHSYGLDDEYEYSEDEKGVYCNQLIESPNIVYFKDIPPYVDDASARNKHKKDVPWMGGIPADKLITNGTDLGSSDVEKGKGEQTLGLYRGGACNGVKQTSAWRPYLNSIMKGFSDDTVYPIYEEVILKSIESAIGKKVTLKDKKFADPSPPPRCIQHNHETELLKGYEEEMKEITKHI